jgi:hypothetical protein
LKNWCAWSKKHRLKATQRFLDRAEQFGAAGVILFTIGLIVVPILFLKEPSGRALRHDCDGCGVAVR